MGLSDRERKILDEIERHLVEEDPRFVHRTERVAARRASRGRLAFAGIGFAVGLVLLFGLTFHIAFGFIGLGVMFASVVVGALAWQARIASDEASHSQNTDRQSQ